jgi:hypothetical protein
VTSVRSGEVSNTILAEGDLMPELFRVLVSLLGRSNTLPAMMIEHLRNSGLLSASICQASFGIRQQAIGFKLNGNFLRLLM